MRPRSLRPTSVYRLSQGNLAVSEDGGRTFPTTHPIALPGGIVCCTSEESAMGLVVADAIAVSPTDSAWVCVGAAMEGIIATQGGEGLWISNDGGLRWRRSGMDTDLSVQDVAVVPGNADTLYAVAYAGFDSGMPGLWRSIDGGQTWTEVTSLPGPVYSVATPTATLVLVGGAARICRSTDAGLTFSSLSLAVPIWTDTGASTEGMPVEAVLAPRSGTLFAGTGLGVARSTDGGMSWQIISEPVGDPPVLPGGLHLGGNGTLVVATDVGTFGFRYSG